jgi:metallo-beta-lactamase family protein
LKLHLQGAVRNVTGSCYIVEAPSGPAMVDCGLYQGSRELEQLNRRPFAFNPHEITRVILTHAHIDHCGLLPRLVAEGYEGDVVAHPATCDLADIMLRDSGHIQEEDAAYALKRWRRAKKGGPRPPGPLYTVADAEKATARLQPVPYGEVVDLSPDVRLRLTDAGHILGSANAELWLRGNGETVRLTFSGDLGSGDSRIIRDPAPPSATDFLVMESTYGNRNHDSVAARNEKLRQAIAGTVEDRACVIIPAFSVGRTQEIVYALNEMVEAHLLPRFRAFVDSPLAISATRVFRKHPECFKRELLEDIMGGDDPFDFPDLQFTRAVEDSKAINSTAPPYVVISAAGMCNAGRIRHHLLRHLGNKRDLILFVGYQARNTLGRRIRDGFSPVRVLGQTVRVKARVRAIDGFSAHADRDGLLAWFEALPEPPAFTIVTHGESPASFALRDVLAEQYRAKAVVPELGAVVELSADNRELAAQAEAQQNRSFTPLDREEENELPEPDA